MTPCGMNRITPTMIRNGQMNIGDKIIIEEDIPVGTQIISSDNYDDKNSIDAVRAGAEIVTENPTIPTSAPAALSPSISSEVKANTQAMPAAAAASAAFPSDTGTQATTVSAISATSAFDPSDVNSQAVPTAAAAPIATFNTGDMSAETVSASVLSSSESAANEQAAASLKSAATAMPVSAAALTEAAASEAFESNSAAAAGSAQLAEFSEAVPAVEAAAAAASAAQPLASGSGSVVRAAGSHDAEGIRQPQATYTTVDQTPPPNWPNRPGPIYYEGEDRNFVTYPRMTDYFQDSVSIDTASATPTFTVPSNPMTPPEYTQTLDYDSIQYMSGFLRTQIGRFIRLEQLVGSNTIEDREGFLVGASNNYVLLQEIGTGNIMTFDLFSIKFVYIYYEDIPRPEPRS